jgi:hypothetical protein
MAENKDNIEEEIVVLFHAALLGRTDVVQVCSHLIPKRHE